MPPITRSFCTSSCSTWPGSTRSGQWAMRMSEASPWVCGKLRSGRSSASQAAICAVVPTGEVHSSTTRSPGFSTGAMERLAAAT